MHKIEEQLKKAQELSFDAGAKERIRGNLLLMTQEKRGSVFLFFSWQKLTASALAIMLLTGSTAFASQGSLPGDFLYPVKVSVIERITVSLTASAQAGAELELKLIDRRAQETEQLILQGAFDDRRAAIVEEQFEKRFQNLKKRVQRLIDEGKIESAERFSTQLEAQLSGRGFVEIAEIQEAAAFQLKFDFEAEHADTAEQIFESAEGGIESGQDSQFRAASLPAQDDDDARDRQDERIEKAQERIEEIRGQVRIRLEHEKERRDQERVEREDVRSDEDNREESEAPEREERSSILEEIEADLGL
ncbi:MAG: hypothetical protein Q8P45_02240 [Candidatus Harrisonbacteria bacterium]|nr:hypothetical protein [Candidatus Harrisonbacteria bacterium]